mmetsp:Transcript_126948/g.179103  ORF Transcript_126948/g.179103 Transcript_126948/m.179103 type:complete len:215 (+) Transcript_126948:165-809(+)
MLEEELLEMPGIGPQLLHQRPFKRRCVDVELERAEVIGPTMLMDPRNGVVLGANLVCDRDAAVELDVRLPALTNRFRGSLPIRFIWQVHGLPYIDLVEGNPTLFVGRGKEAHGVSEPRTTCVEKYALPLDALRKAPVVGQDKPVHVHDRIPLAPSVCTRHPAGILGAPKDAGQWLYHLLRRARATDGGKDCIVTRRRYPGSVPVDPRIRGTAQS